MEMAEFTCFEGSSIFVGSVEGGRDASNFLDQAKISSELSGCALGATLFCCVEDSASTERSNLLEGAEVLSELLGCALEATCEVAVSKRALVEATGRPLALLSVLLRSRGTFPVFKDEASGLLTMELATGALAEETGDAGFLSSNFLAALTLLLSVVLLLGSVVCCLAEDKSPRSKELVIVRGDSFGDDNSSTNTGTFFCSGFVLEANCIRR